MASAVGMPDFTTYAAGMVGVGVGIDYSLFIVTRYRACLRDGLCPEQATVRAMDTAGRAVLFAGATVVISLVGLFVFDLALVRGLAIGMITAISTVIACTLTLLPALLGIVGTRIDKLRLPRRARRSSGRPAFWTRFARGVQRRPRTSLITAVLVLLALTAPMLGMRLGFTNAGDLPRSDTTRRAFDTMADGFGPGTNGPLLLVADNAHASATLRGMADAVRADPGVASVSPAIGDARDDVAVLSVVPTTGPQQQATGDLVHRLRDRLIPRAAPGDTVYVTGPTAASIDFASYTADRMPLIIGVVLGVCFILLLTVFRGLLVALKAVVVNLLSIGAAYGVLVATFQWGWGAGLLGLDGTSPIEAWVPMIMFVLIFGLSMDYEVFLLSRIHEEWVRARDNSEAVVHGLAVTARVITAAAAIMVVVFGGFAFGDDPSLRIMGFGLAVGVLLDATVVRLMLVPAAMELFGDRNWWLPRRLDRILPRLHVERPQAHRPVTPQPASVKTSASPFKEDA